MYIVWNVISIFISAYIGVYANVIGNFPLKMFAKLSIRPFEKWPEIVKVLFSSILKILDFLIGIYSWVLSSVTGMLLIFKYMDGIVMRIIFLWLLTATSGRLIFKIKLKMGQETEFSKYAKNKFLLHSSAVTLSMFLFWFLPSLAHPMFDWIYLLIVDFIP